MGTTEEIFGAQAVAETKPETAEESKTETAPEQTETVTEEAEVSQEEETGKKQYSPEEVAELLRSDAEIDTSRLSIEGQALMRSFQKGLTKKFEKLSKLEKELQSQAKERSSAPKGQRTIADMFEEDPENTINQIDNYILSKRREVQELRADGDMDKAMSILEEMDDLAHTKATLIAKRMLAQEKEIKREREQRKLADFDKKREAAESYITDNLQMDESKMMKLLEDVDMVRHFAGLAENAKAKETAKAKIVKKAPEELGRAGSAQLSKGKEEFNYNAEFKKAQESGDWSAILRFKGAL